MQQVTFPPTEYHNNLLAQETYLLQLGTNQILCYDDLIKTQTIESLFKKEWDKLEIQYQITRELIRSRLQGKISQRELAKKAKTTQAVISRIENMSVSPSVGLLQRIANALDKKLEVKFT